MGALESIRARIRDFAGYDAEDRRRIADEQIRAYVGERLSALPAVDVETLPARERERYDRVLLRAEFLNQPAFRAFEDSPTPERIAALLDADGRLLDAVDGLASVQGPVLDGALVRVEEAFDARDAVMSSA